MSCFHKLLRFNRAISLQVLDHLVWHAERVLLLERPKGGRTSSLTLGCRARYRRRAPNAAKPRWVGLGTSAAWAPCRGGAGRRVDVEQQTRKGSSNCTSRAFIVLRFGGFSSSLADPRREIKSGAVGTGGRRQASRLWRRLAASAPERTCVLPHLRR